jgi:bacillithiol system protein YtxJ
MARFQSLDTLERLEKAFADSLDHPVILFKHSATCPISSRAYDEMSRLDREVYIVVVQESRAISNEISTRTGVQHESPQCLILHDGHCVWNESHGKVRASTVESYLIQFSSSDLTR